MAERRVDDERARQRAGAKRGGLLVKTNHGEPPRTLLHFVPNRNGPFELEETAGAKRSKNLSGGKEKRRS